MSLNGTSERTGRQRRRSGLAALTIMWLLVIPLGYVAATRLIGWPRDLTLLITVPLLLVWVPVSYPLAIAGGEHYERNNAFAPQPMALVLAGALGIVSGMLSFLVVWSYTFFKDARYGGMAVVGLLAVGCGIVAVRIASDLVRRTRE